MAFAAIGLLAAVGLSAWRWSRPAPLVRDAGLSVLLITVDTLRADAVGAYGAASAPTPWIDRLAAAGVRFDRAYAHNVVTLPSHANILSGRYPFQHGVRENAGYRFPSDVETLATRLRAKGYRTGAFVSAYPLDSRFGLNRGFEVYDDRFGEATARSAFHVPERPGRETVALARRWIDSVAASRYFCWVHLYDPHFPYVPAEPYASRFRDRPYAGEVAATDAALAPLLTPILEAGDAGRALVVFTSDHGEGLGDHGEMTHGLFTYESTLRVPLIIYQPRLAKPRTLGPPVRHVDILPTVLDALGEPLPGGLPGRSLLEIVEGRAAGEAEAPSYFEALSAMLNRGWAPLHGVVRGRLKYVDLPIPELYDLADDPLEARDLSLARKDDLASLRRLLGDLRRDADQHEGRVASRSRESAEAAAKLRSLGYVVSQAAARDQYSEDDDPKRLIGLDAELQRVVSLYEAGNLAGAIGAAQDLLRLRPSMALAQIQLAFLYSEAGSVASSADAARKALALAPEAADVAALGGAYLSEAGFPKEARERLEPLVNRESPDFDVLIAYGVALAHEGRMQDAIVAFERAGRIDPSNGLVPTNVGTVHLMLGAPDRAEAEFRKALELDPTLARAHNSLGVVVAERGRLVEALSEWHATLDIDPDDSEALYNIGRLLVRTGRTDEARAYLQRYLRVARPSDAGDIAEVRGWLGEIPPSTGR